jgi:hypothetical protein
MNVAYGLHDAQMNAGQVHGEPSLMDQKQSRENRVMPTDEKHDLKPKISVTSQSQAPAMVKDGGLARSMA